jgi:hypothetical protein
MSRLLVVDDAPQIHALLAEFFPGPEHALACAATVRAARQALGITRGSLRHKIRALGIDVDDTARARAGQLSSAD